MLERIIRSTAAVKVMGVSLFTEGLHLREISRIAGVSPSEAKRELDNLSSLGVLNLRRIGNASIYSPNSGCPFLQDMKNLYLKTEGVASQIKKEIDSLGGVKYSFIFGSMARGSEKSSSDIDLIVIGDVDDGLVSEKLFKIQKSVGREINFIIWSNKDFLEKIKKRSPFLFNISKNKRIWIAGDENEFIRFIKEKYRKAS